VLAGGKDQRPEGVEGPPPLLHGRQVA